MKLDGQENWQKKWISIDTATNLINSLGALNKLNDSLQSQVDGDKIKPETLLNILSRPPLKCNITKVSEFGQHCVHQPTACVFTVNEKIFINVNNTKKWLRKLFL
jgi:hypothetical protein